MNNGIMRDIRGSENDFLINLFEGLFNEDSRQNMSRKNANSLPTQMKVNLKEKDNAYVVEALIPGFSKEDISLSFDDKILTIKAQKDKTEGEEKDNSGEWAHREFYSEAVSRQVRIAKDIEHENIVADYKDGILNIYLPFSDKSKNKQIEIN